MNLFKRFYDYFTAKSVKQRIGAIIAFILLLIFAVFLIKGNFFDKRHKTYESDRQTSASDISQNEESTADNSNTEKSSDVKFNISFIDMGILMVVITFFAVHKFREKRKHGRL